MARPTKRGLDYFPLDVDFEDSKIDYIECMYGMMGVSVIITLWQYIYKNNGYYCKFDEMTAIKLSKRYGNQLSVIDNCDKNKMPYQIFMHIVNKAVEFGIFEPELLRKYNILTSRGIQERYLEATKKRKEIEFKKEYLLIDIPSNTVNVVINSIKGDINSKKAADNPQSKVKESKVKKSRVKDTIGEDKTASVIEYYQKNIAPITSSSLIQYIDDWCKNVDAEVVKYAIDEAVNNSTAENNKRSWKYIEAVIRSHYNAGRKSMEAVKRFEAVRKKPTGQGLGIYNDSGVDYDEIQRLMDEKY